LPGAVGDETVNAVEASEPEKDRGPPLTHLVFRVGTRQYAIEAAAVVEVTAAAPLAQVPDAPPFLLGVRHHAGRIVGVLGLSALLEDQTGVPSPPRDSLRHII